MASTADGIEGGAGEDLKAENARLVAEMASMKKKIMVAFKKQQAELQGKLQAAEKLREEAEQRAAAAEAAAAAASIVPTVDNGDIDGALASETSAQIESLRAELEEARRSTEALAKAHAKEQEDILKRALQAEQELLLVRKELQQLENTKQAQASIQQGLEKQLVAAATQVSDAFARAAAAEEENARLRQGISASEREVEATEKALKAAQEMLETTQHSQMELAEGQQVAAKKLKAAEDSARQLAEDLTKSQAEVANLQVQRSQAGVTMQDSERMQQELAELQRCAADEGVTLRTELESQISLARNAQDESADLREKLSAIEHQAELAKARLLEMEQTEAELQNYKLQVEASQQRHAEELRHLQGEVMRLQADLETARKAASSSDIDQEGIRADATSNELQEEVGILRQKAEKLDELQKSLDLALSKEALVHSLQLEVERLQKVIEDKSGHAFEKAEASSNELQDAEAGKALTQNALETLESELQLAKQKIDAQAAELASLETELDCCKARQNAAEESAVRVAEAASVAEQKVQDLEVQLKDAHAKSNEALRLQDEKYADLDAKFGRLQKRAKQRIQELTKENEAVEAQVVAAGEKTAQVLSQLAALQEELDRTRQHSNEAILAAENEKEKLRSANAAFAEEINDLRRSLEAKEITLNESRRLAAAKEQSLLELSSAAQEEKEQQAVTLTELTERIQKVTEDYDLRLKEVQAEVEQGILNLSELKAQLGEKEQQLAELETATSGEIARLKSSIEAAKGETTRLEQQQQAERDVWETNLTKLKKRIDATEKARKMQEASAAETKSNLESELELQRQALNQAQSALVAKHAEADRLATELAAYKVRAAALLQKKNAELVAAKDAELAVAQEEALKAAQREARTAIAERDNIMKELNAAMAKHEAELAARSGMLMEAEQRVRELATRQEVVRSQMSAQQVEWQGRLEETEAAWRLKVAALEERVNRDIETQLTSQLTALQSENQKLQAEHEAWKEMADRMLDEKEAEIRSLLDESAILQSSLSSLRQQLAVSSRDMSASIAGGYFIQEPTPEKVESATAIAAAEQQILLLARQQAQREEEVAQCHRHIQALQEELSDMERENRLHAQQEALLKDELRNVDRAQKREGVDMTYLKNVILKLLQTGEVMALLPVVAMLLQFSPEEVKKCQTVYQRPAPEVPLSGAAAVVDAAAAAPRSLFQGFSFAQTGRSS